MKRLISFVVTILSICSAIYAQNVTKQVVNVEKFASSSDFSEAEVVTIRNSVIQSLQATKRIVVVDLLQQSYVKAEAERRKSEAAMNDNHDVDDITQLNANYILRAMLNSITTVMKTGTSLFTGQPYTAYETTINYTIQLIDPATGATINSYSYKIDETDFNSAQLSREKAVANSATNMRRFIEEAFPVKGNIVQVATGDVKKAKTVYISLGTEQGISKDQKLAVYAVIDIAGERSEKEVGSLIVQEVLSATRSLCKVNDGGDVIATNMASNNELTVKTIAKRKDK